VMASTEMAFGYDAMKDRYVNMIEAGIIDPTKARLIFGHSTNIRLGDSNGFARRCWCRIIVGDDGNGDRRNAERRSSDAGRRNGRRHGRWNGWNGRNVLRRRWAIRVVDLNLA
jgi:hypothetical protein